MPYYDGKTSEESFKTYATLTIVQEVFIPMIKERIKLKLHDGLQFRLSENLPLDKVDEQIQQIFLRLRKEDKGLEEIQSDIQNLVDELR